jgi:pyruvate dehydrogenase E2 component (dihydrolipoamide acetyltransferase)
VATAIIMPRQGNTVESCIVSKWHVKKGDRVKAGDLLFTYETDKATFDAESTTDGTVLEIFFDVGDDVPVLTNMCVIGEPGEDITPFLPAGAKEEEKQAPSEEPVKEEEVSQPMQAEAKEPDEAIGISPRAKNLAIKAGADLSKAVPTGPKGRIIERDVRSLIEQGALISKAAMDKIEKGAEYTGTGLGGRVTLSDLAGSVKEDTPVVQKEAATPTPEYTEEPLSNIRKLIGKSMHQSLSEMAQLTLHSSFNATAAQEKKSNRKKKQDKNIEQGMKSGISRYGTADKVRPVGQGQAIRQGF